MSEVLRQHLVEIAGPVSRETFSRLQAFQELFARWAERINLASASTLDDVWERHILDSAQVVALAPGASRWLDLGSGGGFPGLVIAILLADRTGARVDLVESNRKKAGFLQMVGGLFALPICVHSKRINDVAGSVEPPDVVTARALAPLPNLLELAEPWLAAGATGLFHKGRDYRAEVQESLNQWQFDLLEHPSRIEPQGAILEISGLARRS